MNLIECYVSASRVVLNSNSIDPSTWQELHTLLPTLHKHFSCRVCHMYLGGSACKSCADDQTADVDIENIILLRNYQQICKYIQVSSLYDAMRVRDEDRSIVELLNEVIHSTNHHNSLAYGTAVINQDASRPDNVQPSTSQSPVQIKTPNVNANLQTSNVQPKKQKRKNQLKPNAKLTKKKKNEPVTSCRCSPTNRNNSLAYSTSVNKQNANRPDNVQPSTSQPPVRIKTTNVNANLQTSNVEPKKQKRKSQPKPNAKLTKKKKNEPVTSCRCSPTNRNNSLAYSTPVNKQNANRPDNVQPSTSQPLVRIKTTNVNANLQTSNVQLKKQKPKNQPKPNAKLTKKKKNESVSSPRCSPTNRHNSLANGTTMNNQNANCPDNVQPSTSQLPAQIKTPYLNANLQTSNVQPKKQKLKNQPKPNAKLTKKKKDEPVSSCRCSTASSFPYKLTCLGQKCPCYLVKRACDQCKCRGCKNVL